LETHLAFAHANSPRHHVHALEHDALLDPSLTVITARRSGRLLGMGALRHLDDERAEIKSMHTAAEARRQGVARAIVEALLALASARGYRWVGLETGSGDAFVAARSLYESAGFTRCAPFGEYTVNPYSVCMELSI
jgi:putative acetyltransferase